MCVYVQVLNMAEYPTFSFMMRMKVQQVKLMKAIREQMAQHTRDIENARENARMEIQDIELIDEENDDDFATTTDRMDAMDDTNEGKSSPEGSNRK